VRPISTLRSLGAAAVALALLAGCSSAGGASPAIADADAGAGTTAPVTTSAPDDAVSSEGTVIAEEEMSPDSPLARAAQASLRNVLTAAKTIYADDGHYGNVDATSLAEVEPSLTYVTEPVVDAGTIVLVELGEDAVMFAASAGGDWYCISDVDAEGTFFGQGATYDEAVDGCDGAGWDGEEYRSVPDEPTAATLVEDLPPGGADRPASVEDCDVIVEVLIVLNQAEDPTRATAAFDFALLENGDGLSRQSYDDMVTVRDTLVEVALGDEPSDLDGFQAAATRIEGLCQDSYDAAVTAPADAGAGDENPPETTIVGP
jgi:hypothetical protein